MTEFSEDSGFEQNSEDELLFNLDIKNKTPIHQENNKLKEKPELEIIPHIPLAESGHSLEPDMMFGWRPNSLLQNGPIPLSFTYDRIPAQNAIFNGYRPEDSLELNETFSGPDTYKFSINPRIKHAWELVKKNEPKKENRPFIGMKEGLEPEELEFSSKFECGNLDKVVKVKENEYDLYLRTDSNTYGHNQWYYFKVSNKSYAREVKFNIVNFSKRNSLYTQGLMPCIYREKTGWVKGGYNITYTSSKVNRLLVNRYYYSLSFLFQFHENDTVFFAYSVPYSYTKLCKLLKELEKYDFVRKEILCKSLGGVETPMLTVTDFSNSEEKEAVFMTARVHPGETHGSWVMEGFLKFITGNCKKAKKLRKKIVFKIVPMLNVDGVIVGNTRCSLTGEDLNRSFQDPNPKLNPVIYHLKSKAATISSVHKLIFYFDLHAHSKKKGVFMYGPHYPLHSEKYCKIKVFPKLISETTEMFRYYSCRFRNEASKRKTARLVMWKELELPYTYTVESSSHGYLDSERATIAFTEENLHRLGKCLGETILEYIEIRDRDKEDQELRKFERLRKRNKMTESDEEKEKELLKERETTQRVVIPKRRTMADIINSIRDEPQIMESESDSSDSEVDEYSEERDELEAEMKKNILKAFKKVESLLDSPLIIKSYLPISSKKKKAESKEKFPKPPMSSLAKYFSRASSASRSNRKNLRFRAESAIPDFSPEDICIQPSGTRPPSRNNDFPKFSYSRGLQKFKQKNAELSFDKKEIPKPKHKRDSKSLCFSDITKKINVPITSKDSEKPFFPAYEGAKSSSEAFEDLKRSTPIKLRYKMLSDQIHVNQFSTYKNTLKKP
ncbi:unnamed protein product [Blepharisma stoltei]|uniref:Peptidase M14 domain-containing protein n=1 Tax=Blepharisma stoltei TaxID=1481888 RepID=A0AAU9JUE6_9CILI|nr:unnamed protein product [Blepharisma stoltei]